MLVVLPAQAAVSRTISLRLALGKNERLYLKNNKEEKG
jgi:hypothetical protein